MRVWQKHQLLYEQLVCEIKKEISVREEMLSAMAVENELKGYLEPLLIELKKTHKKRRALTQKLLQLSPLAPKNIPPHAFIDIEEMCELDLMALVQKAESLKKLTAQKNISRKTQRLFNKQMPFAPMMDETKKVAKKLKTLTIEREDN